MLIQTQSLLEREVDMEHLKSMKQSAYEQEVKNVLCEPKEEYRFPPGLQICLDEESLKKLELKPDGFSIDDDIGIAAVAKVCGVDQGKHEQGSYAQVRLQITDLQLKPVKVKEKDVEETFYGKETK